MCMLHPCAGSRKVLEEVDGQVEMERGLLRTLTMFNPRSKSRKFWVGPEILGHYKVGECGSGTPLVEHFSLDLNIKWSIFGRTQPYAEYRNFATAENCRPCRAAARHAACAWSRWCRARPNVEILQSCTHCEKQPPSNHLRPNPCERHRREIVTHVHGL